MIFEVNPGESINEILNKMHSNDTLVLNDGLYNEKVEIWVENITIKAKNPFRAIIVNKDYYHKIMPNNNECNTFNTFTVYIGSNNVMLKDLHIKNAATPSNVFGQAVALHVDGSNFNCENCIIESAQDTLFIGPMPNDLCQRYKNFYSDKRLNGNNTIQVYKNCKIIGDVDFIFGGGTALFDNCDIITVKRIDNMPTYIAAPSHDKNLEYGFLFYKCTLIGENPTFLARPWRDFGTVAFIECNMQNHILPEGFNKWNNSNRDKTARFFEYSPNCDTSKRVSWSKQLSQAESVEYYNNFLKYINNSLN